MTSYRLLHIPTCLRSHEIFFDINDIKKEISSISRILNGNVVVVVKRFRANGDWLFFLDYYTSSQVFYDKIYMSGWTSVATADEFMIVEDEETNTYSNS